MSTDLILFGLLAAEFLVIGTVMLIWQPSLAIIGIFAAFLLDAITIQPQPLIQVGLNVYAADVVFVPMAIAAFIRLLSLRRFHVLHGVILGLWLFFAISFARGLNTWGLNLAGVEARGTFYFVTAILYLSTVPLTHRFLNRLINTWILVGIGVAVLAWFRWVAEFAGWAIASSWRDEFFAEEAVQGLRVLDAPQTFVIAIAMFFCLIRTFTHEGNRSQHYLIFLFALEIVMLQHRTVWIVTIVGLVWLLVADGRLRGKLAVSLVAAATTGGLIYLIFFDSPANPIAASLQNSATSDGTWQWRLEGWKELLKNDGRYSLSDRLIGQPFGAGFERVVDGVLVNRSPHNFYVQSLIRMGICGLVLLLALYFIAFRELNARPLSASQGIWDYSRFWQMLLLMHLFYFITYAPIYEQGIVIGVIAALVIVGTVGHEEPVAFDRRQAWPVTA